jgi:hypothetical protein
MHGRDPSGSGVSSWESAVERTCAGSVRAPFTSEGRSEARERTADRAQMP